MDDRSGERIPRPTIRRDGRGATDAGESRRQGDFENQFAANSPNAKRRRKKRVFYRQCRSAGHLRSVVLSGGSLRSAGVSVLSLLLSGLVRGDGAGTRLRYRVGRVLGRPLAIAIGATATSTL